MVVELISVGTEILLGNITNTNAQYLSEKCAALGLSCYHQETVGDNEARLEEVIKTAIDRSDVIILTGGLGPTEDDLTKETVAKVTGRALVMDEHSKKRIKNYFKKVGRSDITENNWKQAMIPEGAIVVDNKNGTAPGLIVQLEDGEQMKHILLMPGPPNELHPMFENDMMKYLHKISNAVLVSETVKIVGRGESQVETDIKDMIDAQTNPTIAPYAKTSEVHLRITASAADEKSAKKLIKPVVKELKNRFGDDIYTTNEHEHLEDCLVKLLKKRGWTVTTAESCTGGLLSARIVNVSGASDVLNSAIVTYANEAKHQLIGVSNKTLEKYGAVSEKTAREMAKGAAKLANADVAISVTGIAGPTGGTKEKPVGLVYIGCRVDGKTRVCECHFNGSREKIREQTVVRAMDFARRCILAHES